MQSIFNKFLAMYYETFCSKTVELHAKSDGGILKIAGQF